MNRQNVKVASSAGEQNTSSGADETSSLPNIATLADDGKELAQRGLAYANRTIRENPTLVLAGVVAVGAIAALAIMPKRSQPQSTARKLQRDFTRHTRDIRKAVRQEIRDSGVGSKFDDLGRTLAAVDWKPYVQPFIEQAATLARQANEKLSAAVK